MSALQQLEVGREAILASGEAAKAIKEYPELKAEILLSWLLDQTDNKDVIKLVTKATRMLN